MDIQFENNNLRLQEIKNEADKKYYKKIASDYKKRRDFIHDTKNYLRTIALLIKSEDYKTLDTLVNDMYGKIEMSSSIVFSSNPTINAIIYDKMIDFNLAVKNIEKIPNSANLTYEDSLPKEFKISIDKSIDLSFISDIDLISIFGNALDNSIEASLDLKKPCIKIDIYQTPQPNAIFIEFSNKFNSKKINFDGKKFISTKSNPLEHGFGIDNIKKSAAKYNGIVDIEINNDIFMLSVMINL